MMCMVEEGEGWKVYRDGWRTARRTYGCYECGREIAFGERYFYASGVLNGETSWSSFHVCAHCNYAAQWLVAECNGYLFGGVLEDLMEHWDGELMRDLHIGRGIVGIRRQWRRRDGHLMRVPA